MPNPIRPNTCTFWAQLITNDHKRRKHGPPPIVQDCNHKIRWCDLDIDCSGRRRQDRLELSLTDAWHKCPNKLKASTPPPPSHYLTHFLKHPGCETFIRAKTVSKQHRKSKRDDPSTMKLALPTAFGSIIVADHLKFNSRDEGCGGPKLCFRHYGSLRRMERWIPISRQVCQHKCFSFSTILFFQ